LFVGEVRLPGRKDDRVFARRVIAIHQNERFQRSCQRLSVGGSDAPILRHRQQISRDLPSACVLRKQNVHQFRRLSGALLHYGEDMLLFQHLLVIVLAEVAKQHTRAIERAGIQRRSVVPDLRDAFGVHEQRTAQHAMLAHQVFGGSDLWLFGFGSRHKDARRNQSRSSDGCSRRNQLAACDLLGAGRH
jgi:hypothetical protein